MSWINRDDLIEWLHTEEDEMLEIDGRREAYEASYIRKHVREMPKEDVKPVAHAHWIKSNYDNIDGTIYKCSNCNTEMFSAWNYCPHCGAKMDEQEEEEE